MTVMMQLLHGGYTYMEVQFCRIACLFLLGAKFLLAFAVFAFKNVVSHKAIMQGKNGNFFHSETLS